MTGELAARMGDPVEFDGGQAIPLVLGGKPRVCESTPTIDSTTDPADAREKGLALIEAADRADRMHAELDR